MRRTFFIAAVVVALTAVVWLVACSSDPPSTSTSTSTNQVSITETGFAPAEVSIKAGQSLTWTNDSTNQHTVTFPDSDSGAIRQGEAYSRKFDQAGTYPYVCRYHLSEKGTVTVR